MSAGRFTKDPQALLDYTFEWADWLEEADNLVAALVTVESPLTLVQAIRVGTAVHCKVSGGVAGSTKAITCRVTTSNGLIDERSIALDIRER